MEQLNDVRHREGNLEEKVVIILFGQQLLCHRPSRGRRTPLGKEGQGFDQREELQLEESCLEPGQISDMKPPISPKCGSGCSVRKPIAYLIV